MGFKCDKVCLSLKYFSGFIVQDLCCIGPVCSSVFLKVRVEWGLIKRCAFESQGGLGVD